MYRDPDVDFGLEDNGDEDLYQDIAITQHIDSIMPSIRTAKAGTEFMAVLTNFPYQTKKEEIEEELGKNKIEFVKLDTKSDGKGKLIKANVTLKSKNMAENLLLLHGKQFLTRSLKVDFPDYNLESIVGETELVKVEHPAPSKGTVKPKPAKEELKQKEVKKEANPKEVKVEEVNEDGFIIEHFKQSNTPHIPKPTVRYRKKGQA